MSTIARTAPNPSAPQLQQNHLLAALPAEDFARIEAQLELVPLRLGEMLYEPGEQLQYAYFPTTAIISLHYVMATGASAEAAGVGNEGMLGGLAVHGRQQHAEFGRGPDRRARPGAGNAAASRKSSSAPACCNACCCATPRR